MSNLKFPHLFEPIKVRNTLFKNRIFSAPQDYPGLTGDRFLTEEGSYFYERKALGGFASVCVGDVIVDSDEGRSHPFQMRGNDFLGKVSLTRTSTGINRHGAVSAVELCHAGQNANINLMPDFKGYVEGVVDGIREDGIEIRGMNEEQIEKLIMKYVEAAKFARQCGFGMITLHAGHGWQMSQFISARDNKRTDRWGGSIENRMRFPLSVIDGIRKAIGPSVPIEVRISATEWLPDGYEIDEGIEIAKLLDGNADIIHVSVGHHEIDSATMRTHPSMFLDDGCNVPFATEIKKHVKTPVSTVGALTDPEMMEELIASGKVDIVNLGRQTLADPDLPIKSRLGMEEEINPCLRCFNCFSNSTVGGVFYCASNPEIGREQAVMTEVPPKNKKRVLIAGGGIGGMQAAITAADRGHEVILCEKSDKLGGALLCEEKIPFKGNLSKYLKRQAKKVYNRLVDVRLNTEVNYDFAKSLSPDVIIAALGARPMIPKIKGIEDEKVLGAEEVYYNPEKVGKTAVIMGGGLVGLELGAFLAHQGKDITIVEMAPMTIASPPPVEGTSNRMSGIMDMPLGFPLVHGVALREEFSNMEKVSILTSTKALEVNKEGLVVEKDGEKQTLEAETIIYAIGQKPLMDEALNLKDAAPEFYQLGDCLAPKNIYEATSVAYQIATDLGRF